MEDKKKILKEYFDSVQDESVKKFQDGYEPENYKQQIMSEMTVLVKDYIRQKPVKWSEEDERIRKDIIRVLKGEIRYISEQENEKYIDWLNSLKERMRKDYGK